MNNNPLFRFQTITEYHRAAGLPKPAHPLISLVHMEDLNRPLADGSFSVVYDFYSISMKRVKDVKFKYGQQAHDFDEGVLFFMSPGQVFGVNIEKGSILHRPEGWMILVHPDFLWNTPLAKIIKQYEFFNYSVYEALYLSDKEETMLTTIAQNIEQEYHANIDRFSQSVIIAQLELLLTFARKDFRAQVQGRLDPHNFRKISLLFYTGRHRMRFIIKLSRLKIFPVLGFKFCNRRSGGYVKCLKIIIIVHVNSDL